MPTLFTDAPAVYDGFGTFTVCEDVGSSHNGNRTVRMVCVESEHLEWQRGRYMSGLHMACDLSEYSKQDEYNFVSVGDDHRRFFGELRNARSEIERVLSCYGWKPLLYALVLCSEKDASAGRDCEKLVSHLHGALGDVCS